MRTLTLSETVGAIDALTITTKDTPRGITLDATLALRVMTGIDVLDSLGKPDEIDDEGVVVSSLGNGVPSDVWRQLFNSDGVPLPLGVKEHVFDGELLQHVMRLDYSAAGKRTKTHEWHSVKLTTFKATLMQGPGVCLTFKAKLIRVPQLDIAWLCGGMCAAVVNVSVKDSQEALDLGGAS